jgi:hypothetical protein
MTKDNQDTIKGRIEAFDFMAKQLATYADDASACIRRGYYSRGTSRIREEARRDCQQDLAKEIESYADDQRKLLLP